MKTCPKCGREYEDANTLCPADGEVLQRDADELIGQTLASKYRVEARLDEGGMGTVYRATHILMEKTVAIKVLHPSLAADDKIVARFTREARAASRISHPHALNVTDFGESENGVVFLVMEYLRGRTLKDIIRSEGPLPLTRIVEIIRQICGALDAAHSEGVVHRDLKSDNIMLEETGGGDWAKVLDFGIAKIQEPIGTQDPGLTAPNLIIGTPQYMSPEQCSQASEIDARSDIYSLGVILYEMLIGHVPFTGDSPTAIMMKHLQEPAPSIMEERKDVPPAVGRVVARALAKRREDRYQSAGELSEHLALAATGKEAPAPSTATAVAADAGHDASIGDTNRIVVPTAPNEAPRATTNEERDEATVVHVAATAHDAEIPSILAPTPPPASSFNPLRIVVPALVLLVVVFGVVYFFQRGTGDPTTQGQEEPLIIDPQGLPVQPAAPATGAGEANITPGTPQTGTTPQGDTAGGEQGSTTPVRNANSNATESPTPGDANRDTDADTNDNETPANDNSQTDPPANRNTNRRAAPPVLVSPTPAEEDDEDDAPPPRRRETPAATPPPDSTTTTPAAPAEDSSAPLPSGV